MKKILQKYTGNKPLLLNINENYPRKCWIYYNAFEKPNQLDLLDTMKAKKLPQKDYNLVFGIKAKPEQFEKLNFLWCPEGSILVVHYRVVEKFKEFCPNDFQALPITIKNFDGKGAKNLQTNTFENKNFYLINILKLEDIYDKSFFVTEKGKMTKLLKTVFNQNCMNGALLARDKERFPYIFFDPSLANHFINTKGIQFCTEEEAPR